jgi:hypothetical protein
LLEDHLDVSLNNCSLLKTTAMKMAKMMKIWKMKKVKKMRTIATNWNKKKKRRSPNVANTQQHPNQLL